MALLQPDWTRASQLIPHVRSTLESYQSVVHTGYERQASRTMEYGGTMEELREMLGVVIQQAIEHEEFENLQEQLSLLDQITEIINASQQNAEMQNSWNDEEELEFGEKREEPELDEEEKPINTQEVLDLIEKEEEENDLICLTIPPNDFECTICYMETKVEDGYMFPSCFHYFCKEVSKISKKIYKK